MIQTISRKPPPPGGREDEMMMLTDAWGEAVEPFKAPDGREAYQDGGVVMMPVWCWRDTGYSRAHGCGGVPGVRWATDTEETRRQHPDGSPEWCPSHEAFGFRPDAG